MEKVQRVALQGYGANSLLLTCLTEVRRMFNINVWSSTHVLELMTLTTPIAGLIEMNLPQCSWGLEYETPTGRVAVFYSNGQVGFYQRGCVSYKEVGEVAEMLVRATEKIFSRDKPKGDSK